LNHAPDIQETNAFMTDGMNIVDQVLSHMDDKNYDVKHYTVMEKMVHRFHMEEVWKRALIEYLNVSMNPPTEKLCSCLTDVANNGIYDALLIIASQIRNPEKWTSTKKYDYTFYSFLEGVKMDKLNGTNREEVPELVDEKSWKVWKKLMHCMNEKHDRELAKYLYCQLKPQMLNVNLETKRSCHRWDWIKCALKITLCSPICATGNIVECIACAGATCACCINHHFCR